MLAAALALAAAPAACKSDAPSSGGQRPRADVVKTAAAAAAPGDFCDAWFAAGDAPELRLPEAVPAVAGGRAPGAPPRGRWLWLNLWATWCQPCLREMPLLRRWHEVLGRSGAGFDLWLLSLDENAEDLAAYLSAHPEVAGDASLRAVDADALPAWLSTFGLPADASIPVHVLVGPSGRVRCVRAGGLQDDHYPAIRRLMAGGG